MSSYTHLQSISNLNPSIVKSEDLYELKNYPIRYKRYNFVVSLTKNTFNSKDFFNHNFNIKNYIKTNASLNYYISNATARISITNPNTLEYTARIISTSSVITGEESISWSVLIVDDTTPYDTTPYYFNVELSQSVFNSSQLDNPSFNIKNYIKTTSGLSYLNPTDTYRIISLKPDSLETTYYDIPIHNDNTKTITLKPYPFFAELSQYVFNLSDFQNSSFDIKNYIRTNRGLNYNIVSYNSSAEKQIGSYTIQLESTSSVDNSAIATKYINLSWTVVVCSLIKLNPVFDVELTNNKIILNQFNHVKDILKTNFTDNLYAIFSEDNTFINDTGILNSLQKGDYIVKTIPSLDYIDQMKNLNFSII
jgi:hypothetical protein